MSRLCLLFGITRQAYYQYFQDKEEASFENDFIIEEVNKIRENHPRIGTRKLYVLLEPFMLEHQIKLGRDALFDLLCQEGLLIRRHKRSIHTTNSFHRFHKYDNLIKDFIPTQSNQLWVSDITYWKIEHQVVYISLITDAYSHKIVGYYLAESLQTIHCIQALKKAISSLKQPIESLIHHSDRGVQYCSNEYVKLLQDYNINISMSQNSDPLENSIAERVNGIIKTEYLECYQIDSYQKASDLLDKVVKLYNEERPHMSIGNLYPNYVHEFNSKTEKLWKNYFKINNGKEMVTDS